MGLLTMLGLMKVEDHKAETLRLNLKLAKQGNALSEAKSEARKATDDLGKLVKDYATRGDLLAAARGERDAAVRDHGDAVAEIAVKSNEITVLKSALDAANEANMALMADNNALRPDAEKFRAKAARDAEVKRAKRAAAKKVAG